MPYSYYGSGLQDTPFPSRVHDTHATRVRVRVTRVTRGPAASSCP